MVDQLRRDAPTQWPRPPSGRRRQLDEHRESLVRSDEREHFFFDTRGDISPIRQRAQRSSTHFGTSVPQCRADHVDIDRPQSRQRGIRFDRTREPVICRLTQ
jgi:hypothetical protein